MRIIIFITNNIMLKIKKECNKLTKVILKKIKVYYEENKEKKKDKMKIRSSNVYKDEQNRQKQRYIVKIRMSEHYSNKKQIEVNGQDESTLVIWTKQDEEEGHD